MIMRTPSWLVALLLLVPRVALADDESRAEALFQDGRALLAKNDFEAACPKLALSQKLDPGDGTLLALATCHEGQGKLVDAFGELTKLAEKATTRADRAQKARERLAVIGPKLARLTLHVTDTAGVEVLEDGVVVDRASWTTETLLEAGSHVVEARAPGKKPFRVVLRIEGGKTTAVAVPALDDVEPPPQAFVAMPTESPPPARTPMRIAGVSLGVAGAALVGLGIFEGLRAVALSDRAKGDCDARGCSQESIAINESAKNAAHLADIAIPAGVALAAGGTLLFVLAPKGIRISPYGAGAMVGKSF